MEQDIRFYGCVAKNDEWKKMFSIWDSCAALGIAPPPEVSVFFNHGEPDHDGSVIELEPDVISRRGNDVDAVVRYRIDLENLSDRIEFLDVQITIP